MTEVKASRTLGSFFRRPPSLQCHMYVPVCPGSRVVLYPPRSKARPGASWQRMCHRSQSSELLLQQGGTRHVSKFCYICQLIFLAQFVSINKPSSILFFIITPWKIMFPFSKNFVAGLLQQVCQLCEEQPGRDAEAGGEKSFCLQKSSTFFLNWN